jgi:PAS domain S-box-containing protein
MTQKSNIGRIGKIIEAVREIIDGDSSLSGSWQRLSDIISASPVGIAIYDSSGQCVSANDSFARMIGASKQQALEQNYNSIESWKKTGLLDMARTVISTQSARHHEVATTSSFGKKVFLDCHLVPFGVEGLLFMAQDITERKRVEEELKTTLRTADDIVRYTPFGMLIYQYVAPDKLYLKSGNPEAEKITGVKIADLIGKEYVESWPGAEASGLTKAYLKVMQTGDKYETDELYYKDERLEGSFHICAFRLPNDLLAVSFEDISERKQWAEALSESEATLRSIYESSPMLMGVVELTEDDKIFHIYDNPATARFFGVPYQGTKHKTADELGAPSDAIHEWLVAYRKSRQQGKPVRFEYIHHTPDRPLWLSATVSINGPGQNGRS